MNAATLSPDLNDTTQADAAAPLAQPASVNHSRRFELNSETVLPESPKRRRPSLKHLALAALLAGSGLGVAKLVHHWWAVGRFIQSTDDAYVGGDVTVIAPKVAGFIAQLAVADNQAVRAGDLLIKLDDRDYRAALAKAEAAVAEQQATLANLDATRRLQDAVVEQGQAAIAAADAEITRTRDDRGRSQRLSATGAESAQQFEKDDADYKEAVAAGDKARAALTAAQRQLDVIASQKAQVTAALAAAVAERDMARLNLSYTELRAPVDGTIGNRSAQVGAYATAGAQLISLVPAHGLWIDANFKEDQLVRVRPGSPASVKLDSIPGRIFRGHVVSIAPATGAQFSILPPENATGNFTKIVQRVTVRLVIDDEAATMGQLRPGLSAIARVDTRVPGKAGL
jgi:membrane fusion protein (multidrug efflux system)